MPAGKHHIRFVFDPDSVRKGDSIAVVCVLLMYAIILAAIVLYIIHLARRKKNAGSH